jgi:hypothetical protein
MNRRIVSGVVLGVAITFAVVAGGNREEIVGSTTSENAGITVEIDAGSAYLHRLRILPLIRVKSPPQIAVWVETESGEFLETLYVTSRAGTGSWRSAPLDGTPAEEITRPEALPVWSHRAGRADLTEGTAAGTDPDAVTSATPKSGYSVKSGLPAQSGTVRVLLEVNHSTDFNRFYPRDAAPGTDQYSGGPWGSGQPSLVYGALVDVGVSGDTLELELLGHGSPTGEDGAIYADRAGLTSALQILQSVRVTTRS